MNEIYILKNLLEDAITEVYAEKRFVLSYKVQTMKGLEQAFAFRVGIHLHKAIRNSEFNLLDLDSEYNKSLGASKMLEEFEHGIRPDLILHQRGTHKNNKLAIEFKGHWNRINNKDKRKLIGLTSSAGDYNYTLGALCVIGAKSTNITYYIDGKIANNE